MSSTSPAVLVTGAGGSAGANFCDALRRSDVGYRIIGGDASVVRLHLSTADDRCALPPASDPAYGDGLRWAVKRWGADVVHAQPDVEVLALGRLRDDIGAATFLPTQAALETAQDKSAFARAMAQAGVEVPESRSFDDWLSVGEVTSDLLTRHERVWVRAKVGAGARASLPVRDPDHAESWLRWWASERGLHPKDFMAAEMLPGREFAYQSVWKDGHLLAGQARERVEYLYGHLTPHGQTSTPAVARTVSILQLDQLAAAAVHALDATPSGVYCVDIKEAADGRPKVTEINAGRFFTTSNFFAAAGLNMPDMVVRCALGEEVEPAGASPLPADLYWIRMVDMGCALVPGDELDRWPHILDDIGDPP
jgi:carbamoyl-phosphate synthase large subunit